jgi:hypothetical protein
MMALGGAGAAYALSAEQLKPLAEDDFDAKVQVISQLAADGSEAAQRILAAVQADTLYARSDEALLIQDGDRYRSPVDGAVVAANADDLNQITLGNVLRTRAANALAGMQLRASDPAVRLRAINALMAQPDPNLREPVETARRQETDPRLKAGLDQLWALTALHAPDPQSRAQACFQTRVGFLTACGLDRLPQVRVGLGHQRVDGTQTHRRIGRPQLHSGQRIRRPGPQHITQRDLAQVIRVGRHDRPVQGVAVAVPILDQQRFVRPGVQRVGLHRRKDSLGSFTPVRRELVDDLDLGVEIVFGQRLQLLSRERIGGPRAA